MFGLLCEKDEYKETRIFHQIDRVLSSDVGSSRLRCWCGVQHAWRSVRFLGQCAPL